MTASDRNRVFPVADVAVGNMTIHMLNQFATQSDRAELRPGADAKHRHAFVFLQHQPCENPVRLSQLPVPRRIFYLSLNLLWLTIEFRRVIVDPDKQEAVGQIDVLLKNAFVGETWNEQRNTARLVDLVT